MKSIKLFAIRTFSDFGLSMYFEFLRHYVTCLFKVITLEVCAITSHAYKFLDLKPPCYITVFLVMLFGLFLSWISCFILILQT